MHTFFQFAIIGCGLGAGYALLAQGIVFIHRGSGVINFAQGAIGMSAAYIFYELNTQNGWGKPISLIVSVAYAAAVGVIIHLAIMRPLRHASQVVRTIATLGVLIILQSCAVIVWGPTGILVGTLLPQTVWHVGSLTVTADRMIVLALVIILTAIGWLISRRTNFGRATLAVAESERSVAALGWSPDTLAAANWSIGCAMAGLAGVVLTSFIGQVDPSTLTLVVISALAAALIGGLNSLPWTLVGALGIGIAESELPQYWSGTGVAQTVPLIVIILILVIGGRRLPGRGQITDRLPAVGTGAANPLAVSLIVIAVGLLVVLAFPGEQNFLAAIVISGVTGILALSLVFLTGYSGQISLCQYASAGIAALIAGQCSAHGWAMLPAALAGIAAATIVGSVIALPALRTRGVTLAIVTLALGLAVTQSVFQNPTLSGGMTGINIGSTSIFGLNVSQALYPDRYTILVLLCFTLLAVAVSNVRRSRVGRRLIAVRSGERAAAALGVNVAEVKWYAFTVSSMMAGVAGVLIAFTFATVVFDSFSPLNSIEIVAFAVIGGIGYISGALPAGLLVAGGLGTFAWTVWFGDSGTNWLALAGGVLVLVNLITAPDGLAKINIDFGIRIGHAISARMPAVARLRSHPGAVGPAVAEPAAREAAANWSDFCALPPVPLEIKNLTVRFGGTIAVDNISLRVDPGEIVGLIGPNGAGKTTTIDAITGFVRPAAGSTSLGDLDISRWSVHRRARTGLSRSFQSLELFESLSSAENLHTASDHRDRWAYLTNLFWPDRAMLPKTAALVLDQLSLSEYAAQQAKDLPQGHRRMLSVGRAVATRPRMLLLDEPSAGLGRDKVPELAMFIRCMARDAGMGVLLIEHDMDFVMSVCDRIVVLDFGQIIADGPPAAVRADPQVNAAYLGAPEIPVTVQSASETAPKLARTHASEDH